ncbi:hypothetical protein WH47_07093 [Habropoda laboriosa]|uniref:Uncharacterized protein n=1 Tax=Habropoda laboriosa TaxID=597456 RepID=A0A0L7QRL9_9HYME|nr:hypothetical protein WH47_07093 [Habropoda laboriosa]
MTWNGCFLRSKTLELEMFMLTNNIIIATIQETWLSPKTDVTLSGYHIVRKDRSGGHPHGGVAILIHKSINYVVIICCRREELLQGN